MIDRILFKLYRMRQYHYLNKVCNLANYNIKNYKRIYLYHIRKTGGTSLNHIFLSLGAQASQEIYKKITSIRSGAYVANGKIFVNWNYEIINKGLFFYGASHYAQHELQVPSRTYKITCLRDPVSRVISHYKMLLEYKTNNINHVCMKEEGPWLGNSFSDFLQNIPKKHLVNQLYMFSKNYNITEATENIFSLNKILFTENLAIGLQEISNELDLFLPYKHIRKANVNPEISSKNLNDLKEMLSDEIQFYENIKKEVLK